MSGLDSYTAGMTEVPENLFHTVLTVVDLHNDPSGGTRSYYVLGTHGTLEAAKVYSTVALQELGFHRDDFDDYAARPAPGAGAAASASTAAVVEQAVTAEAWPHGEGVLLFARAPAGHEFTIRIDTTPNNESLRARAGSTGSGGGALLLPDGARFLHYVLQTTVDYNVDRTGAAQTAEIEGAYVHRADAWTAAHRCLDRDDYAEYDSRGDAEFLGEWPYGEDVVVHAVADTGQNFQVAVKTPPHGDEKRRAELKKTVKRHKAEEAKARVGRDMTD
ncbi:hypothetical protein PLIIFM63780_007724 [Purpureocillium lilacinum]|uniref:Uncharacterized protein n=1 Tax=Purpureocillium lilacinum TaxID=33203 RepID=A0ACC4E3I0_PURLI|nr:hypothetical protein PLIIFM63780_007724 [Purpureocillium lilacinum]